MKGTISALFMMVILHGSAVYAEDWPVFHGPNRCNRSTETGLLKSWPKDGPPLLWTASDLGKGYSSVTISKGNIYTAGSVKGQTHVISLGLDGKQKWKVPNGSSWKASSRMRHATAYDGARATPTVDGEIVYHLGETGRLAAMNAADGKEIWTLDVLKKFNAPSSKYGLCESVLVVDDKLICCPGGAGAFMVALDKKTGKTLWVSRGIKGTVAYSSASIATFAGRRQVLNMSSEGVFGVDLETGKLLWQAGLVNFRNNNCTDPIFHDDCVFASSGYGAGSIMVRLEKNGNSIKAKPLWKSKVLDNHHGGVVLIDGRLYGSGHQSKGWHCLDFKTGKAVHRGEGKGSLTYAEGMLYCLDETGTMSLVKAEPGQHAVVSSFTPPKGGRGLWWAHPVVCSGRLYIRHDGRLFAYDIKAGK